MSGALPVGGASVAVPGSTAHISMASSSLARKHGVTPRKALWWGYEEVDGETPDTVTVAPLPPDFF